MGEMIAFLLVHITRNIILTCLHKSQISCTIHVNTFCEHKYSYCKAKGVVYSEHINLHM